MEEGPDRRRLRWRCRRGMRELDVLLERFVDNRYDGAPEDLRLAFGEFLALPDPEILGLLVGRLTSDDPALCRVVELVRAQRVS